MTALLRLHEADVPRAVVLGHAAGFQTEAAIWSWIFSLGTASGFELPDGALGGTVVLLSFGPSLAMVAMMMVHPSEQRRGHGRRLLAAALDAEPHASVALYATEVGAKLYRSMGFREAGTSTRYEGAPVGLSADGSPRPIRRATASDAGALATLDGYAQGGTRTRLLRSLSSPAREPSLAYVMDGPSGLDAFGFVTLERGTWRLGPIVAERDADALAMVEHLAQRKDRVRLDLEPGEELLAEWATSRGLARGETSPRMCLGAPLPGHRGAIRTLAGRPFG